MKHFFLLVTFFSHIIAFEDRSPLHNYVSGDAFRAICHFHYEEECSEFWHKPSPTRYLKIQELEILDNIKDGDLVFIQTHLVPYFVKHIHPKIEVSYFLVSHKSDCVVDERFIDFINDSKLVKWFAQNVNIKHEKVVPIPIGIPIKYWLFHYRTKNMDLIEKVKRMDFRRKNTAYLNVRVHTCEKERNCVRDFFQPQRFVTAPGKRNYRNYLKDLKKSRFCISPSGNGIDCWRTWEALMMGSIPIVCPYEKYTERRVVGDEFLYEDLPVIRVKFWSAVNQSFLDKEYARIRKMRQNYKKLYFPFWKDLIEKEVAEYHLSKLMSEE